MESDRPPSRLPLRYWAAPSECSAQRSEAPVGDLIGAMLKLGLARSFVIVRPNPLKAQDVARSVGEFGAAPNP